MTTQGTYIPVPALPVKGPQLSLLSSSVAPKDTTGDTSTDETSGATYGLDAETFNLLPSELKLELAAREGAGWTRGFAYLPENSSAGSVRLPSDGTTVDNPNSPANLPIVRYQPFLVETKFSASSFGWEELDYKGRGQRQNDAALAQAIGREFCDGALAQANSLPNNYLSQSSTTVLNPTPGTAVSLTTGLGLIQDYLSQTGLGGQGMIHLIPRVVPSLLVVRRVGKLMLDLFDNIVVPDPGYTGNGPGTAAPASGTTWIYATDIVMTRIESEATVVPDVMAEALDRGSHGSGASDGNPNLVTFRAFRFASAYFDGFRQAAVQVNLPS